MTMEKIIAERKRELEEIGLFKRLELWLKLHKEAEIYNNIFGVTAIICAAVSSQLSESPKVLLVTGLVAALSTSVVTFLNLKARSVTYINAWRMLDKEITHYLSDRGAELESVGDAAGKAEEYIQNSLHKA